MTNADDHAAAGMGAASNHSDSDPDSDAHETDNADLNRTDRDEQNSPDATDATASPERPVTQNAHETATDATGAPGSRKREQPLAAVVADLQERVAELEAEQAALKETVATMETELHRNSDELKEAFQTLTPMRKLLIGEGHDAAPLVVMKTLRERQGPINQQLAALTRELAQQPEAIADDIEREVGLLRAEQNAKLRQVAAATDVDLDAGSGGGDVITRVRVDGIEAVCATPRKRDRRAGYVLQHIEEWGRKERLRTGPAYRLPRPRIKRLLNAMEAVTVTMTSKTVGDVFDAIETLAAGSPRHVHRRKHDGVDNLYVGFPATETS